MGKKEENSKGGLWRLWILYTVNLNNWVKSRIIVREIQSRKPEYLTAAYYSIAFYIGTGIVNAIKWNIHFPLWNMQQLSLSFRYDSSLSSFCIYLEPCVSWWPLMTAEQFLISTGSSPTEAERKKGFSLCHGQSITLWIESTLCQKCLWVSQQTLLSIHLRPSLCTVELFPTSPSFWKLGFAWQVILLPFLLP